MFSLVEKSGQRSNSTQNRSSLAFETKRTARLDRPAVGCRMHSPCDTLRVNAVVGVTLMLLKWCLSVHAAAAGTRVLGFVTVVPPYSRDCHVLRGDHRDQHPDHPVASPSAATATRSVVGAQRAGSSLPIYVIGPTQLNNAIDAGGPQQSAHLHGFLLSVRIVRMMQTFQVKTAAPVLLLQTLGMPMDRNVRTVES